MKQKLLTTIKEVYDDKIVVMIPTLGRATILMTQINVDNVHVKKNMPFRVGDTIPSYFKKDSNIMIEFQNLKRA
jgi:hypothetical protein